MSKILIGITGSIAAYKIADLVSELVKNNHEVHVVMSESATKFITPLTLQVLSKNTVHCDIFQESKPDKVMHIELAKQADVVLIAPASANVIGKIANGLADDMLTCAVLAANNKPILIAPAMNTNMYENIIVQSNIKKLNDFGFYIIEPRESLLACNDFGKGALATNENILSALNDFIK